MRLDFEGLDLEFALRIYARKVEGEASGSHVRRGKLVTGYNFELSLSWTGRVNGGNSLDVHGTCSHERTVDDDEPEVERECAQAGRLPFWKQMRGHVVGLVSRQCALFVKELKARGEQVVSK